jgi:hypothetical protein
MKKAFFERIELSRRSFLFGVELMRWFLKTYFVLSMLRQIFFISLLSLFIAPLGATEVLRLTAAEPVPVFRWNKVNFSYCSGELPAAVVMAKTMALSRRDMKWLETTFKNKQPASVVAGPGFRFARQFLFALKKRESQALLFEYPSDASKSFVVQITYNVTQDELCESSPKAPWTDVTIYASSEKIPKHVLEFVKTCVLQRGWFRLNKYKTMVFVGLPITFVASRVLALWLKHCRGTGSKKGVCSSADSQISKPKCVICLEESGDFLCSDTCNCVEAIWHAECFGTFQEGCVQRKNFGLTAGICTICRSHFSKSILVSLRPKKCERCSRFCLFANPSYRILKQDVFPRTSGSFKSVYCPWAVGGTLALVAAHFADLRSN